MDISTMTNCSVSETSSFFADEVENSSALSSSGERSSWSSCPHASEHKLENENLNAHVEHEDKQSEISDLNNREKKLSRKWISCLKSKEAHSGQYLSDARLQTETTQLSNEELDALQSFCASKINLIHYRVNSKEKKTSRHKKLHLPLDAGASEMDMLNWVVPKGLLNRIYLKDMTMTLKQVTTTKQHVTSQCPDCIRKTAELALSAFLKQKKTLLESRLLQEKIDEHLHTKDFLTLIGELHQDLPRLSDDPRIIWKRLTEKSVREYSDFKKPDTEQTK